MKQIASEKVKTFYNCFQTLRGRFSEFEPNSLAGLSKLHSMSSEKFFEEKA